LYEIGNTEFINAPLALDRSIERDTNYY